MELLCLQQLRQHGKYIGATRANITTDCNQGPAAAVARTTTTAVAMAEISETTTRPKNGYNDQILKFYVENKRVNFKIF